MAEKKANKPDPKMLKYLDLLMNMDVLENEEDWEVIEGLTDADIEDNKGADEFEELEDES